MKPCDIIRFQTQERQPFVSTLGRDRAGLGESRIAKQTMDGGPFAGGASIEKIEQLTKRIVMFLAKLTDAELVQGVIITVLRKAEVFREAQCTLVQPLVGHQIIGSDGGCALSGHFDRDNTTVLLLPVCEEQQRFVELGMEQSNVIG